MGGGGDWGVGAGSAPGDVPVGPYEDTGAPVPVRAPAQVRERGAGRGRARQAVPGEAVPNSASASSTMCSRRAWCAPRQYTRSQSAHWAKTS